MSTQHTPGPWHVWSAGNIQTLDGEQLGIVRGIQVAGAGPAVWAEQDANDRRDAANARLMAAAPTLLAIVEFLHEWVEADADAVSLGALFGDTDDVSLSRAIRDAIAAATSEEK